MQTPGRARATCASRIVAFVGCVTALSCGGQSDGAAGALVHEHGDSGTGGSPISLGSGGSSGSGDIFGGGAGGDAVDANVVEAPVDAGPQPVVVCGGMGDASVNPSDASAEASDASRGPIDGAVCEPPPSHCADETNLVYYTDGHCVAGLCQWTTQILKCRLSCSIDGCRNNFTLTR